MRDATDPGNHSAANFARDAGFVQMREKQTAQSARGHSSCQISIVEHTSQAISPIFRDRFRLLVIEADGGQGSLFTRSKGQCEGTILFGRRPCWIKHSRAE